MLTFATAYDRETLPLLWKAALGCLLHDRRRCQTWCSQARSDKAFENQYIPLSRGVVFFAEEGAFHFELDPVTIRA